MIQREDILSMEYLKKTEYTACHQGMRYRLEQSSDEAGEKKLKVTVWPEPFNFASTPEEQKQYEKFPFSEEGLCRIADWLNERYEEGSYDTGH